MLFKLVNTYHTVFLRGIYSGVCFESSVVYPDKMLAPTMIRTCDHNTQVVSSKQRRHGALVCRAERNGNQRHAQRGAPLPQRSTQQQQPGAAATEAGAQNSSSRREALAAAAAALPLLSAALSSLVLQEQGLVASASGRADAGGSSSSSTSDSGDNLTDITARVYLDIGMCEEAARQNRTLGDKSILCEQPAPLGRIVIGLYGNAAPDTAANFLALVRSGALEGTTFHKVFPGEYLKAGRQGSHRSGAVEAPADLLVPNGDVLRSASFRLRHDRPGTVSLALAANDDDAFLRERRGYRPLQFMVTTGPGPQPSLDGNNIVFGRVLEGLGSTVAAVATVPTFSPSGQLRAYNSFASLLGDDRAVRARASWGLPLKAVVITGSGVLA